jgi:hypothetical protein
MRPGAKPRPRRLGRVKARPRNRQGFKLSLQAGAAGKSPSDLTMPIINSDIIFRKNGNLPTEGTLFGRSGLVAFISDFGKYDGTQHSYRKCFMGFFRFCGKHGHFIYFLIFRFGRQHFHRNVKTALLAEIRTHGVKHFL